MTAARRPRIGRDAGSPQRLAARGPCGAHADV